MAIVCVSPRKILRGDGSVFDCPLIFGQFEINTGVSIHDTNMRHVYYTGEPTRKSFYWLARPPFLSSWSGFRVPPTRPATGTATTGIAQGRNPTISPTLINSATSRITDMLSPSPTTTGSIGNGTPRLIPVRGPAVATVIKSALWRRCPAPLPCSTGGGAGARVWRGAELRCASPSGSWRSRRKRPGALPAVAVSERREA
jgi:hypothetical protein